ncbi:GNAT family N-acetyltransferase [Goodfellowiella coeruleoviolacea]|uniref:GNAT family N-acetyltransferase n=1 Tax=Goodfellowiella coeruleoviolacea TaxID=334858 RepID=UPI0020A525DD|nr:GNAT family N-acetyltransferase [Goodfellowiella coeruleoviolacea]
MDVEVLDPRFDPEPAYWSALRERAGLRADWAWEVLVTQAWCARTPQPVVVLRDGGAPAAVVAAAWISTHSRRHRFVSSTRGGRLGGLDVRSPGSSAVPGWWFADADGADAGCGRLLTRYVPVMRRELGAGLRGLLVRQVPEAGVARLAGRFRLVRRTEDVGVIDTAGLAGTEDWLAGLGKKRRHNLRRIAEAVRADPALEVAMLPGAEVDPVRLAALLRHNERKHHDVPIVPLPQFTGYLTRLLRQPDVLVLRYQERATGRLVAAALVLDHPNWPVVRAWSALPVDDGGRADLYFHFYGETVRWAAESGRHGVIMGKKLAHLKKSLGARLVPQYAAAIPL